MKQLRQDLFENSCRIVSMSTGHKNRLNKCDRAYSISVDDVSDRRSINHSNIIYTRSIHVHLHKQRTSSDQHYREQVNALCEMQLKMFIFYLMRLNLHYLHALSLYR